MPKTAMMRLTRAPHSDILLIRVWYSTLTMLSAGNS